MPISWNEIRQNAVRFSREWSEERREKAEAKSFWDEFFAVFGIRRRLFATFEEPVKKITGQYGYIDLFWPGVMLAEHKSRGKSLDKAESQAFSYIRDIAREQRHADLPRYVILSDFDRVARYDLETEEPLDLPLFEDRHYRKTEFPLKELHKHIHEFAFIAGYQQHRLREEDPINIKAVDILGDLHDVLAEGGYAGHDLERFLVRILFCLFADDTGLFEPDTFKLYIENRTANDGSDLGMHLAQLFEVLDTPPECRQKNLDDLLAAFPYVNGELFKERLGFAAFNRSMRDALIACMAFDWSRISPAIFGSLFQGVMDPRERRQTGGHYTSECDILKVINALFMDALRAEFEKARRSKAMLKQFHEKMGRLRFFDPACGCGNFLVITYRELRLLEIEVLQALFGGDVQLQLNVHELSRVNVDAFTGIEIQEWPARIAEVAMWLMDHQMNMRLSEAFGQYFVRLPLRKSARIVLGNALRLDWKEILSPDQCSYVLGNPPFVGKHYQTPEQKADMVAVFGGFKNIGDLDYVTCWHYRAADYIQGTAVVVGFVSTNSITQGEQVPLLWGLLFGKGVKIHFAYRTFRWQSEARGKAHVHVVIIGFAKFDIPVKRLFDYDFGNSTATVSEVANISPYLTPGPDSFVTKRQKPLSPVPEMRCGNKPVDGGNLILTDEEKAALVAAEPNAKKYLRRFTGSEEFINGNMRWCLWLADAEPDDLRGLPRVMERVERVRAFREKSTAAPTRRAARTPALFFYRSQPDTEYILIPEVSSERRHYIPIGIAKPSLVPSNKCFIVPTADLYLFGVLTSAMHMAWMRQVGGRLESRYSYSRTMVYNTFPWPLFDRPAAGHAPTLGGAGCVREAASRLYWSSYHEGGEDEPFPKTARLTGDAKKMAAVEAKAQAVLDARAKHPLSTLADLYDPLTMPEDLVKAHADLDRAVDQWYRPQAFTSDAQRVEFLFALYERYTAPLLPAEKTGRR